MRFTAEKTNKKEINMDPTSSFDLIYRGMSEEDRQRLGTDIDAAIERSINGTRERMAKAFQDLANEVKSDMLANVWGDYLRENSGKCDFVGSIIAQIWKAILMANPAEVSQYKMGDLVARWRKNFPAEWAEIVNADAAKEIEKMKEQLAWGKKLNTNRD